MSNSLIICIGNIARGDDGVAHHVATRLHDALPRGSRVLTAVDLDVAMAPDVGAADAVIIVDACRRDEPAAVVESVAAIASGYATGHGMDAPTLLALTQTLFGAVPTCHLVSVAAPHMDHGESLSETARAASEEAARVILRLVEI